MKLNVPGLLCHATRSREAQELGCNKDKMYPLCNLTVLEQHRMEVGAELEEDCPLARCYARAASLQAGPTRTESAMLACVADAMCYAHRYHELKVAFGLNSSRIDYCWAVAAAKLDVACRDTRRYAGGVIAHCRIDLPRCADVV